MPGELVAILSSMGNPENIRVQEIIVDIVRLDYGMKVIISGL